MSKHNQMIKKYTVVAKSSVVMPNYLTTAS